MDTKIQLKAMQSKAVDNNQALKNMGVRQQFLFLHILNHILKPYPTCSEHTCFERERAEYFHGIS